MQIRVPVIYDAEYIPKRARKSRHATFGEWKTVEIRTVDPDDAPVAARWIYEEPRNALRVNELRWFDGKFWKRCEDRNGTYDTKPMSVDELVSATEGGQTASPLVSGIDWKVRDFVHGRNRERMGALNPDEYRSVVSTDRKTRLEDVDRMVENTCIIDGEVWTSTPEPVLTLDERGGFSGNYVYIDIVCRTWVDPEKYGIFRLDRLEDAVAYAQSRNPHAQVRKGLLHGSLSELDVFMPDVFTYDDETPCLLAAISLFVQHSGDSVKDMVLEPLIAWVKVRDALQYHNENPSDEKRDALVDACRSYLSVSENSGYVHERLKDAIDRWDARPIAIDMGKSLAL